MFKVMTDVPSYMKEAYGPDSLGKNKLFTEISSMHNALFHTGFVPCSFLYNYKFKIYVRRLTQGTVEKAKFYVGAGFIQVDKDNNDKA